MCPCISDMFPTREKKTLRKRGKLSSTPPSLPLCIKLFSTHLVHMSPEHLLCAAHSTKWPFRSWLCFRLRSEH